MMGRSGQYLVVWPSSYLVADAGGAVVIIGPEHTIVAREGQVVTVGGGEVADDAHGARQAVSELTGLQIPSACPAQLVWNAGAIVGP